MNMAFVLLPCDLPTWPTVQRHLTQLRLSKNSNQLMETLFKIHSLCSVGLDPEEAEESSIKMFDKLKSFIDHGMSPEERNKLFSTTIPTLVDYAQKLKMYKPAAGLHYSLQQQADCVQLDRRFIMSLLACSFVSCFPKRTTKTHPTLQDFNFAPFFEFLDSPSQRAKLRSLFCHFEGVADKDPVGKVTVRRLVASPQDLCSRNDWINCQKSLCPVIVRSQGLIEDAEHDLCRVCFLSSKTGGKVFQDGYNQEACQFMTCPELLSTMCFVEDLDNNEAFLIDGYQPCLRLRNLKNRPTIDKMEEVPGRRLVTCAIDADDFSDFPLEQYDEASVLRELNKALLGFHQPSNDSQKWDTPTANPDENISASGGPCAQEGNPNILTTKNGSIELENEEFAGKYIDPRTLQAFGIGGLTSLVKNINPHMASKPRFTVDSPPSVILEGHESRASEDESPEGNDSRTTMGEDKASVHSRDWDRSSDSPFENDFWGAEKAEGWITENRRGPPEEGFREEEERTRSDNNNRQERGPGARTDRGDSTEGQQGSTGCRSNSSSICSVGSDELVISSDGAESSGEESEEVDPPSPAENVSLVSTASSPEQLTLKMPLAVMVTPSSFSIPSTSRKPSRATASDSDSSEVSAATSDRATKTAACSSTPATPEPNKLSPLHRTNWFCVGTDSDSESVLYGSCVSDYTSDDEYFSAPEGIDRGTWNENTSIGVAHWELAEKLFEALELARKSSIESEEADQTNSLTDDEMRFRRRGSAGFYLDSYEASLDDNSLAERSPIDARSRENLSFSRHESSKYSFSSDFSSDLEDLYEQFSHWLDASKDPESRVVAVSKFAHNLLKRGLSDTYVNIAMGIESLCDNPRITDIMKKTPHLYSEVIQKFSRSLSLTEKLSSERDALQRAKNNVKRHKETPETDSDSDKANNKAESDSKKIDAMLSNESVRPIATGNWGCGVNAGDLQLKAVIQWLAASMAAVPFMVYYTCSHPGMKKFESLVEELVAKEWTVSTLAIAMFDYTEMLLLDNQRELEEKYLNADKSFDSENSFFSSFSVKMEKSILDHLLDVCNQSADTKL